VTTAGRPNLQISDELRAAAWPTLGPSELGQLAAFGSERPIEPGEVLFRAGDSAYDFLVILEGEVEVVRADRDTETLIAVHGAGRFLGELNLLTGQRAYLTARVSAAGRALAIPPSEFRRLMSSQPTLADMIFRALVARREYLRTGAGASAVRIFGSRYSPDALALRAFASRNRVAHTWVDVEEAEDVDVLLASIGVRTVDMPVVLTPTAMLRRPTPGQFAEHLGLTFNPTPGFLFDLVVVGTGPAGLAAAVYGASEGLTTVSLDAVATGGQAGSSSRIENYVGFPNGISGDELASRAAIQAQRLGARLNAPCEVTGLHDDHGFHVVELGDGSEVPTKAVIIASGARYLRLQVEGRERFEGAGVYYAATDLEARICNGCDVLVVGGGNSAGQAAIFLAQQGCRVSIAVRSPNVDHSMSHYLVERIEADPRIAFLASTEVRAMLGDEHLESVIVEHTPTGERRMLKCAGLFCFIGAAAATGWLGDRMALSPAGFILTDRSLPDDVVTGPAFAGRAPLPFETSIPGVFAVGDVRDGSLKRVAAAVGEGSSAVRSVHEYLADLA
jgi:thioredoxin reductase (NADPH)